MNIPTVKELFDEYSINVSLSEGHYGCLIDEEDFKEALIKFAKLHVQAALKQASEKVRIQVEYPDVAYQDSNEYNQISFCAHEIQRGGEYGNITIQNNTILEAYPLENIK